jgi:hypothetical protein
MAHDVGLMPWIAVGLAFALGVLPFVPGLRRDDAAQLARLESDVRLPLPEGLRIVLAEKARRHELWTLCGGMIGVIGATGMVLAISPDLGAVIMVGGITGGTIGGAAWIAARLRRVPTTAPRVARSTRVTLADYVPASRVALTVTAFAMTLAAAVSGMIGLLQVRAPGAHLVLVIVGAAVSTIVMVAVLLIGRSVVSRAQPAESPLELAWDDALRGEALAALVTRAAWSNGGTAAIAVLTLCEDAAFRPAGVVAIVFGAVALGLGVVLVARAGVTRAYAVQRLWPDESFGVR